MTEFSNHTQFPNSESNKFHGDATHGDWVVCEEMKQKGGEGEGEGEEEDEAKVGTGIFFLINFYDYIIYKLFIIILFIIIIFI